MEALTKDLMSKNIVSLSSGSSMLEAYQLMFNKKIRHLPIMDNNQLVGILSDRDVLKAMNANKIDEIKMIISLNSEQKVKDFMSRPVYTVSEDSPIEQVVEHILQQKISAFVVEDKKGKMIGIVTTDDLLKLLLKILKNSELKHLELHPTPISAMFQYL